MRSAQGGVGGGVDGGAASQRRSDIFAAAAPSFVVWGFRRRRAAVSRVRVRRFVYRPAAACKDGARKKARACPSLSLARRHSDGTMNGEGGSAAAMLRAEGQLFCFSMA